MDVGIDKAKIDVKSSTFTKQKLPKFQNHVDTEIL